MYIGEFQLALNESWPKNSVFDVLLWSAGEGNSLVPVLNEQNRQKVVQVMNVVGTFGYKSSVSRYCMVTKINDTYWAVSAEC